MYSVVISQIAQDQIETLYDYIARDNVGQADLVVQKVYGFFDYLRIFPKMGKPITSHYREFVETKYRYRVIYTCNDAPQRIEIVSILKYQDFIARD
ncbi:type II toxin-antitoxin system RelE/ParE family toxin [Candidatus Gracilibacteria bacterium]|nr:type II toxin-antitoxin system RelE/ParE family toxin [Candidatus Gracilibacteria bacterium]